MPYIGNVPADKFSTISYQDLTGGSGTSFTLDFAVGTAQEIEVFVNNVRQEPGVAYTVSGTALTMTGSIASTDDFYIVFQSKAQQTIGHPANAALAATSGTFSDALSATSGTFSGALSMGSISGGIPNLVRTQVFTSSGTYTPATGATKALVYVTGAGGGGGGVDGNATGDALSNAGSAGGTAIKLITSLAASYTVTIGAAGSGGAAGVNNGSNGGDTTFTDGASLTLTGSGGNGGTGRAGASSSNFATGALGGAASGGDINLRGGDAGTVRRSSGSASCLSYSGGSFYGGSRAATRNGNGRDGGAPGAGGGSTTTSTTANYAGGDGAAGIVVIYEYL